jgi:hypothetical protein
VSLVSDGIPSYEPVLYPRSLAHAYALSSDFGVTAQMVCNEFSLRLPTLVVWISDVPATRNLSSNAARTPRRTQTILTDVRKFLSLAVGTYTL